MKYRTVENDMLDRICHEYYGTSGKTVEAVLKANPGLADRGTTLPAGLEITLPDLAPDTDETATVRLWD
ncbi:MAG: tail protein X [Desulfobacterales bacterium]|nr:tail protein X [Desulfobacterales bacterium]